MSPSGVVETMSVVPCNLGSPRCSPMRALAAMVRPCSSKARAPKAVILLLSESISVGTDPGFENDASNSKSQVFGGW